MKSSTVWINGIQKPDGFSPRSWIEEQIGRHLLKCARCSCKLEGPEEYTNIAEYSGQGDFTMTLICDICTERVKTFIEEGA
jgi:hypothetical protein